MRISVRPELKLVLTVFCVLAVYYQSINHPFSLFDDPFIVEYYARNNAPSFLHVISPGSCFYYRPIITLSFWLDSLVWGLDPTFMHLENIVVHLVNVVLVYKLASLVPVAADAKGYPYLCALLFGLHPINSESVNWIAARTDPVAGMFVLFAFYCVIRAMQEQSIRFAVSAFGAVLLGILSKETAAMIIPAAFLVIVYWPGSEQNVEQLRAWKTRFLLVPLVVTACLVASLLFVVFVKGRGNTAVSAVLESGTTNLFVRSFEAFGFYVKKFFIPFPLNVAIVEISSAYAIVGVFVLLVLIILLRRGGMPGLFFSGAAVMLVPALLIAVTNFTWTPFGERYLYIPSAFAVIGCLDLLYRCLSAFHQKSWFMPVTVVVLLAAAFTTVQRGVLWSDNLALIEDIVAKSPAFGVARNEYGVLLKKAGRYGEAEKQFRIASVQQNKPDVARMIKLNLIAMKMLGKQAAEAREILLREIGNKPDGDIELLKLLNRYDEELLMNTNLLTARKKIAADIIETNNSLYRKTLDPFYLYRSGQLALSVGNRSDALFFFTKTWKTSQPNVYYRESARKLAEKIGSE